MPQNSMLFFAKQNELEQSLFFV